jgi:nucleoside transporter
LNFTPAQVGGVYGAGTLATMISPLIAGQIADRWFPTQWFLSISYLLTGVLFFIARSTTDYAQMWWLGFGTMLFFGPTLGLANSMCFHHLSDARREFPAIRSWGTWGWIIASAALSMWMKLSGRDIGDCLTVAAGFSVLNAIYSATLPNTPPKRESRDAFAVGKVLAMLKDPSFAVFSFLAFALMVFASFYYFMTANFLPTIGIGDSDLPLVLLTGQIMEIATIFLLPIAMQKLGSKTTIALGLSAWALRFFIFGLGHPTALVVASQSIHGIAFAGAIAGSMIYAERICAPDVRGSMQSFLSWLTYGLGMYAGAYVGGQVSQHYSHIDEATKATVQNWPPIWNFAAIGCTAVVVLFVTGFRARDTQPEPGPA